MHGHLIAVEVRAEGGADQRVDLDRLAVHQDRLEGLDAQPVQRRGAVQQDRVVLDHLLQGVPHLGPHPVHHLLRGLHVGGEAALHQPLHDEGLEQLQRHLLRQAALVQLEVRIDHDHGAAGVVHALAQQVLAEAPFLALEHVGEGLERPVVRAGDGPAAAAVINERVHRFLQQPLLVVDDRLGRVERLDLLQPVVAVDDAAVEVVQVRGGEAAAVELHHRAQFRRDDGDDVQDHPLRPVPGLAEGLGDLQPLDGAGALRAGGLLDLLAQLAAQLVEIDLLEQFADRGGAQVGAVELLVVAPVRLDRARPRRG